MRVRVLSLHTSVPAHATVLTADPRRNASQHILTAINAYPFRSGWGLPCKKGHGQSKTRHIEGRKKVPKGKFLSLQLAFTCLVEEGKPEQLERSRFMSKLYTFHCQWFQ